MKITLEDYQKEGFAFTLKHRHGGLFIDPGLGKTAIILSLIKTLKLIRKVKRSLIIAPIRPLITTWPDEIKKWDQFSNLTYTILRGNKRFLHIHEKTDIHLINPENFNWALEYCKKQKTWPYDLLAVDESTKFKTFKSKRFKYLKKCIEEFTYRYIMTGTPMPNSYLDLFCQMYIVDPGILGKHITHYRTKYFYQTGYQNREWKLKKHMDERIQKKIAPHVFILQNHKGLPDFITNDINIKLEGKLLDNYKSLEKKLFLSLDTNKDIYTDSAAEAYGKCRQFTSGQIYDEEKNVMPIHDLKIQAMKDLIAELQGQSLLISYYFKHELQRFKSLFGKKAVYADQVKNFSATVDAWNDGKVKLLIAQNQSLAHGLNLQKGGHHILWFSLTDSHEDYAQFNRRLLRKGQKNNVIIHRLIIKNTVDIVQKNRLKSKGKNQTILLKALQEYKKSKVQSTSLQSDK